MGISLDQAARAPEAIASTAGSKGMSLKFEIRPAANPTSKQECAARIVDPGFGRIFTDHMAVVRYDQAQGWHDARIDSRVHFPLDPALAVLHYAQEIFEGLKAYKREVIETVQPLLSKHFNLTVELPLKAVVRGHSFAVVPTSWTNRTSGEAKLKMKEMGSRYLFIVLYVWLEKVLSRGDYQIREPRTGQAPVSRG